MINRREFLGITAGAGASLALTPELARALQQSAATSETFHALQSGPLIERAIPSTGEMLPVISFGPRPTAPPAPGPIPALPTDLPAAREVLKVFVDKGGKVVDVLHGGDIGEQAAREAASESGIPDKFFWTTPSVPLPTPLTNREPLLPGVTRKLDPAAVRGGLEQKLSKFKVNKIDLVMVSSLADVATHLAVLNDMKKEGRVRYVGVHHLAWPADGSMAPFGELETVMRNEKVDFVATDYSLTDRRAEDVILPLARERKIAFMAYFPFDRARGLGRTNGTPLPAWAADFDAKTWAQFFLKYVIANSAVTVVRVGTTNGAHMLDNIAAGMGRLPNAAMRKRMQEVADSLPQPPKPLPPPPTPGRTIITAEQVKEMEAKLAPSIALSAAMLDRYVGEYKHASVGTLVTIRREGEKLIVKVHGNTPEERPFVARTETHFAAATVFTLDFQLDSAGRVTGATWGQGPERIPLERR